MSASGRKPDLRESIALDGKAVSAVALARVCAPSRPKSPVAILECPVSDGASNSHAGPDHRISAETESLTNWARKSPGIPGLFSRERTLPEWRDCVRGPFAALS
jgi:hypothetical protein